ncbi:SBBP repeat-containing protein [Bacteroidota bacterium]
MKKVILIGFSCSWLMLIQSFAQNPSLEWVKSMGNGNHDVGYSITTDTWGNVLTTGKFTYIVDFDPGPDTFNLNSNHTTYCDAFVQKLDSQGNFIWARSMGGYPSDIGQSITTDVSGNVYITGIYRNYGDYDPGPGTHTITSNGDFDIFILKLDSSGTFVWARSIGGTGYDKSYQIIHDGNGNLYLSGYYQNTVDFNWGSGTSLSTSNGAEDIFLLKLTDSGNFTWARTIGGTGNDRARSIALDTSGNIYITGEFENTADFDPDTGTFYLYNSYLPRTFVLKLDTSGNFIWAKSANGGESVGNSIVTDSSGNVYLTGYFKNIVSFNPNYTIYLTSNGNEDVYVAKLDTSGNSIWQNNTGGSNKDKGHSITTDPIGNIYITGHFDDFDNPVDFDPDTGVMNLSQNLGGSIFVQKLDPAGNLKWAIPMGGQQTGWNQQITLDANYDILLNGCFESTADFDPSPGMVILSSYAVEDIFVAKLSQCIPSFGSETITACNSYTWPANNNTYTTSGTYTSILTNSANCDSLVTLNLTIINTDNTVLKTGITLTANQAGASYQWLDCNNAYAVIGGAVNQSFTASFNGDYAVEISYNGCVDTSACYSISTIGFNENSLTEAISIHPNPTTSKINIEFPSQLPEIQINLINLIGKIVQQQKFRNKQNINLDIEGSKGIYFLEIISEGERVVIKVVKR